MVIYNVFYVSPPDMNIQTGYKPLVLLQMRSCATYSAMSKEMTPSILCRLSLGYPPISGLRV